MGSQDFISSFIKHFFFLTGNVNAARYRDNVSRQAVMPFMPRYLLRGGGGGGGGGYFSMTMH